jgi:hypothetical protein
MDWVSKRARQEDALSKGRVKAWDDLLLDLQSAANSYTREFGARDNASANYKLNGDAAYVVWEGNFPGQNPRYRSKLNLWKDANWEAIHATYDGIGVNIPSLALSFALMEDEQVAFVCDGKRISDVCQFLLEPLFFPVVRRSR